LSRVRRARPRLQALLPRPRWLALAHFNRDRPRRGRRRGGSPSTGPNPEPRRRRAGGGRTAVETLLMPCRGARRSRERSACFDGGPNGSPWEETRTWGTASWDAGWPGLLRARHPGRALHARAAPAAGRARSAREIACHRGMARFYRRFDATARTGWMNRRGLRTGSGQSSPFSWRHGASAAADPTRGLPFGR